MGRLPGCDKSINQSRCYTLIDSVHIANLSRVLSNPNSIEILLSLLHEQKNFSFFSKQYGHKIAWSLSHLEHFGVITKILNPAKIPIAYDITEYGRWVAHSCINFSKRLDAIPQ